MGKILTKKDTMKIILLNILFISALFAQTGLTVVGGLNQSNQNSEEDLEGFDINYVSGYNFAVEKSFGIVRIGVGLNQRGVKMDGEESLEGISVSMEIEQTLNYLTLHAVYPYEIQENIGVFGGVQLGKGNGGTIDMKMSMSFLGESVSEDVSEDFDAEDMELEYGLLLGGNYMINEKVGVRASYFKGLSDLAEDAKTKNNTISVSLLFNL